jgi:uncharacterized protein DUF6502
MKSADQARINAVRSLARALVPLARLLMQRDLGVGSLILAAKLSYLRAATEAVPKRGTRLNISQLSVITGMTRKEVTLLLKNSSTTAAHILPKIALEQRTRRVIRGWATDPLFKTRSGRPAELCLHGGRGDFPALVRAYGGDVTPASVLKELERVNAIKRTSGGKVRLLSTRRFSDLSEMEDFARLLKDFIESATHTSRSSAHDSLFFGFRDSIVSTSSQAALFQRTFSHRASALLEGFEEWKSGQLRGRHGRKVPTRAGTRVGVGIYLVQNDSTAEHEAWRNRLRHRRLLSHRS